MTAIQTRIDSVVSEFRSADDKDGQLFLLKEKAAASPPFPDHLREKSLVEGCLAQTWIAVDQVIDDRYYFHFDCESKIMLGVMAVIFSVFNGATRHEIEAIGLDFLPEAGIQWHLTSNRRSGIKNIHGKILNLAQI